MYALKPFIEPELDLSKYSDQLKTEQWKLKRLEILERDENQCQLCFNTQWLQVHHKAYLNKHLAWQYPNSYLITLCRNCHEIFEENRIESNLIEYPHNKMKFVVELYRKIKYDKLEQREINIIHYINKNQNKKRVLKLDAEILLTNNRSFEIAIKTLTKSGLIKPTEKTNFYQYNELYFG